MKAIEISVAGGPEVLQLCNRPKPVPQAHEVLIQVSAAGLNRPDIMQRKGLYPAPPGASDLPGLEVAGIVAETGAHVTALKAGDEVCALLSGGGYAQYCTAAAELCLPIPANLSHIQAAALPETFFTVWSNLFNKAQLSAGQTVLVHGGSSGIGSTAIQLAKNFGARIIVSAGSEQKCQFCRSLGANLAINYNLQDFANEVLKFTDNQGVDIILDIIGGDYFPRNLKCLTTDGHLIQIAVQNGPKTEINLLALMLKRLTISGSTLRARDIAFKAAIAQQLKQLVWPLLATGQIKPVIDRIFPLADAASAHLYMESGQHMGKIILSNESFHG